MSDLYDIIDPSFHSFVLPNARLEKLGEDFPWLEGPVWFADHRMLLFSDIPNNRVMRWTESGGISVHRQPSHFENGHARDKQGRLIACSHHGWISRAEIDGTTTILADRYREKPLNSPNDVVVKSDGTIWFSDPHYGLNTEYEGGKRQAELPANVYRLEPETGALDVVAGDFEGPNGLCFSPDEHRLYIVETGRQFDPDPNQLIRVFDVQDDGRRLGGGREFARVSPRNADGIRCDEDGNIWSSAGDGVHCFAPSGKLLGKIKVPSRVSNLEFGGRNRSQLFLCASHTLYAIYVNRRGAARP